MFQGTVHAYCTSRNCWIDEFGRPLPDFRRTPLGVISGSTQFKGDISVVTWNSNALFCTDPILAKRKLQEVVAMSGRHDVTFVQEVHGGAHDARRLEDILRETHKIFFSPHTAARSGGLLTIIRKSFLKMFDRAGPPRHIETGRLMAIDLFGTNGNCTFTNVHNDPHASVGQQRIFLNRIFSDAPCQKDALHVIGGDFNFVPEGETRFNASLSQVGSSDKVTAEYWANASQTYTEWHQEQFTRGQNCETGFVMSRLDRIYSNHYLIDIYDACISAATEGNLHNIDKLSDHLLVSARFARKQRSSAWRSVPSWVCQHPFFPTACEAVINLSPYSGSSTVDKVLWAKQVMRIAARRVVMRARTRGARTVPEQLHWMCTFLRATRTGNHLMANEAAIAFPAIWNYAVRDPDGSISVHDVGGLDQLLRTTMETDIDARIASIKPSKSLPEYKAGQEKSKLNEWRKQWSFRNRRKSLQAAKSDDGTVIDDPDVACETFANHWSGVFDEKGIDMAAARDFLDRHARRLPNNIVWTISSTDFNKIIARCTDSATGPDGLPYSAWANAPDSIRKSLYDLYVALLSTDTQPGASFNYAWLMLLHKGEDPQDANLVARAAEDTRPLSASNTDCKIIASAGNEPLRQALPDWAREEQRGFVMTRQLIDNVIDVDTDCHIASHLCPSGAVLALFDFAAVFPSVAWLYLFLVLEFSGVPDFYIKFVKKLYTNARHYLRLLGRTRYAFTPLAGTKQGCPLSGSLFVLVIDPVIAFLQSRLGPCDSIRAFADDLAAVIRNMWLTLPGIVDAFMIIARVTNLHLKIKKTTLVPLWRCDVNNVRMLMKELVPSWAEVGIKRAGKYLGFMLGPNANDMSWDAPVAKWESRVLAIRSFGIGLFGSILQYNSLAISCMGFISQLEHVPVPVLHKETRMLQLLTRGPYNAISKEALVNLRLLGLSSSFKSLRSVNLAAMYRAARYTSKCLGGALTRYNHMLESDDLCMKALPGDYYGIFGKPPIALTLDRVARHIGFPAQVKTRINERDEEFHRRQKKCKHSGSIQKEVYDIYQDHVLPFHVGQYMERRLSRWSATWDYFPPPHVLARRALHMLRATFKRPTQCVIIAVIKTLLNAWVTSRRFQNIEWRRCNFGCTEGDDSIEHYAVCPSVQAAWHDFAGLPSPNGPLGFMCLAQEHNIVMKLRMAFLFCVHSVTMRLHAHSETTDQHNFVARVRERRRFILGVSSEIRGAVALAATSRQLVIDESWPEVAS